MMKPDALALMNTGNLAPPVVELGLFEYPADPIGEMRAAGDARLCLSTPRPSPPNSANIRLGNTVMLGAIADHLPFSAEVLERCMLSALRARARRSSR
jgi:indolepyruvate ferredoxin oxidoreductase beta subunit